MNDFSRRRFLHTGVAASVAASAGALAATGDPGAGKSAAGSPAGPDPGATR